MSDQQQVLRLLATIREEVSDIRTRQEELYEILVSYKDQIQDLKQTVNDGLAGLPKSPYIAGQLVPAPERIGGVDDFRQLLATYLHGAPPQEEDDEIADVVIDPPTELDERDVKLEPDEDRPSRRRNSGGGRRRERSDPDLSRGPDRDVVPLDLDDDGPKKKKKRRRRTRKKKVEATDD